jgi:hypothetical protein
LSKTEINVLTSVDLADGRDSDGRPDVDVTGQGSAPGVIPVLVVGSELLRRASLHNVHPIGELYLAALLHEGGQRDGELLLVDILDSDGRHLADICGKELHFLLFDRSDFSMHTNLIGNIDFVSNNKVNNLSS